MLNYANVYDEAIDYEQEDVYNYAAHIHSFTMLIDKRLIKEILTNLRRELYLLNMVYPDSQT